MVNRFQHLLVPVDLSDADTAMLDVVLDMATAADQAQVTLLHVIEAIDEEADPELEEFYASLEEKARQKMADIAGRFDASQVTIEQEVVFGKRVGEIVRFSVEREVDLVVMRSEKVDLAQPQQGWSNLSHQVTILCQCPVLLLK